MCIRDSGLTDKVNPLCFLRHTGLTKPGKKILELAKKINIKKDKIRFCHNLNILVSEAIFKTSSLFFIPLSEINGPS